MPAPLHSLSPPQGRAQRALRAQRAQRTPVQFNSSPPRSSNPPPSPARPPAPNTRARARIARGRGGGGTGLRAGRGIARPAGGRAGDTEVLSQHTQARSLLLFLLPLFLVRRCTTLPECLGPRLGTTLAECLGNGTGGGRGPRRGGADDLSGMPRAEAPSWDFQRYPLTKYPGLSVTKSLLGVT